MSIEDLSKKTSIMTADIVETLKNLRILLYCNGKWTFSINELEIAHQNLLAKEKADHEK